MIEGMVEGLYMPDRGFSGLPIYLTGSTDELSEGGLFRACARRARTVRDTRTNGSTTGRVLASSPVGRFYKRTHRSADAGRAHVEAGACARACRLAARCYFLPGVPLRTVNDREGFISARVDYLNHLFSQQPVSGRGRSAIRRSPISTC